jgi:beta-phosphoglucomutase
MSLQAIVFDFDGVIADTEPVHLEAFQEQLMSIGLELSREEYMDRYLGYSDREGFEIIAKDRGRLLAPDEIDRLIARKTVRVQELFATRPLLFPGAALRIREWAPLVPLAIASGALRAEIEVLLAAGGLVPCFPVVVSANDPVEGKPSPRPYQLAMSRLASTVPGLDGTLRPERCVAIEDSRWGIVAARAAGMRVIGVTSSYSSDELREADLVAAGVGDVTLEMLEELAGRSRLA